MGWVLFKTEELKTLRDSLHLKMNNITLLLSAARFHGEMPAHVAAFKVETFETQSAPPSHTNLVPSLNNSNTTSKGSFEIDEIEDVPRDVADSEVENIKLEHGISQPSSSIYTKGNNADTTVGQLGRSDEFRDSVSLNAHAGAVNEEIVARKEAGTINQVTIKSKDRLTYRERKRREVIRSLNKSNNPMLPNPSSNNRKLHSLIAELHEVIQDKEAMTNEPNSIKFKDAVGRKFTFPFRNCKNVVCKSKISITFAIQEAKFHHLGHGRAHQTSISAC